MGIQLCLETKFSWSTYSIWNFLTKRRTFKIWGELVKWFLNPRLWSDTPKKRLNFINQGQYNISIQNEWNGDIIQRLTYSKIQYPRTTVLKCYKIISGLCIYYMIYCSIRHCIDIHANYCINKHKIDHEIWKIKKERQK